MNLLPLMARHAARILLVELVIVFLPAGRILADSIVLSEQWRDLSYSTATGNYTSTDTGTLNASLTLAGLASLSDTDWSNLVVTISPFASPGSYFSSAAMSGAPGTGGSVSATKATFYFQGTDTNGNSVNIERLIFSRAGNVLTIADQTLNPPAYQPPMSFLAANYFEVNGPIAGTTLYQVNLQGNLRDGSVFSANVSKVIYLTGTDTVTNNAAQVPFDHIQIQGVADFTPPTLTAITPRVSGSVTNALLDVVVEATDSYGVTNVEFYLNELDYGPGIFDGTNKWSMNLALLPGTNTVQTVATDANANVSPTNLLVMTYADPVTKPNSISFSEHLQDSLTDGSYVVGQDVGVLNAAWTIPGLNSMSDDIWTNLVLTFSFGNYSFSGGLADASILTGTNAGFYEATYYDFFGTISSGNIQDVLVSRSGNTLLLVGAIGNPAFQTPPDCAGVYDFVSTDYLGSGGPIQGSQGFALTLQDQTTGSNYANISGPLFFTGTDVITYDAGGDELDNIQVAGGMDLVTPSLSSVSPAASLSTSNGLLTVAVKAIDNFGVTNVEFYWDGQDFGPGTCAGAPATTNIWSLMFALAPGTNWFQTVATDVAGNHSPTNLLTVTYVNRQTNASAIRLAEEYRDDAQVDALGETNFEFTQDVGILTAALPVSGLQAMTGETWSNLQFSLAFGQISFSNSLLAADVLTPTNASFNVMGLDLNSKLINLEQLTITRSGDTLLVFKRTGNASYAFANTPIVAGSFRGVGGPIQAQQPFALTLVDGQTADTYASVLRPVFIIGTDTVGADSWGNELDDIQLSGQADFTPPTNQIIAPASGQQWSNAWFNVLGRAGDNILVTNVLCSLNNLDWVSATSTNQWTNWSAALNLTPGTNTLAAYAVDASGNASLTNTVVIIYESLVPLRIALAGLGRISPNYSNALLNVGQNYFVTSSPAVGFVFTNWIVATNGLAGSPIGKTNLQFMMVSNLALQANFLEISKPVLTIATPTANQKMSNALARVTGTATDNWQLDGVWYQVNGGPWNLAPTTNQWVNWGQTVTLLAGTNTINAYAVNQGGNYSATNGVSFTSLSAFKLQLSLSGQQSTPSNGLAFTLELSTNLSGHLQYSTNLVNWLAFATFTGTNATLNLRDAAATNSGRRFYRATIP